VLNCGQSCVGAKRFICVPEVYDEFVTKLAAQLAAVRVPTS
jgi:acyl-CoA reductase-like NAD-dependent aldehyde dehydrogenase